MRKLLSLILFLTIFSAAALAQTPGTVRFPTALDGDISLLEVKDRATTTLASTITSGSTTWTVVSTSLFPATGILTIDDERVYYTAKTSTTFTVVRGQFGSTAAAHSAGATIRMNIVARHHEALRDALVQVETKVGYSSSTPTTSGHVLTVTGAGTTAWAAPSVSSILPVVDTQTIIKGSADATKLLRFEVDGFTTATTRVATLPNADIVVAGSASALTVNRFPYATTGGILATSGLRWDNSNEWLGIGLAPVNSLTIYKDQNSSSRAIFYNVNVGGAADAGFSLNNGTANSEFVQYGSGYSTSAYSRANGITLRNDTTGLDFAATGASGTIKFWTGGSNLRGTLDNAGLWTVGSSALTSQFGVVISSASVVGTIVRGAASQSANLQEWQNSAGTVLASVSAAGAASFASVTNAALTSGRVPYATTGGLLTDSASLTFNGTTLSLLANIDVNAAYGYQMAGSTILGYSGGVMFINDLGGGFSFRTSGVTRLYAFTTGEVGINTTSLSTAQFNIVPNAASKVGTIIRGAASQSANLQEWQNSAGTVLASVSAAGAASFASVTNAALTSGRVPYATTGGLLTDSANLTYTGTVLIASINDGTTGLWSTAVPITIRNPNGTNNTTTGFQFEGSAGNISAGLGVLLTNTASSHAQMSFAVRGANGFLSNALNIFSGGEVGVGNSAALGGQFTVSAFSASTIGAIIRGAASQTANLQEWQNSAGTVLSAISKDGFLGLGLSSPTQLLHLNAAGGSDVIITYASAGSGKLLYGLAGTTDSIIVGSLANDAVFRTVSTGKMMFSTDGGASSILQLGANNADITIKDAVNLIVGTTTGTKFGTATSQKLAFFNSTPIVQPSGTGETVGFTAGGGTAVTDSSTFTGNVGSTAYRLSDLVKALKNLGLIAQ